MTILGTFERSTLGARTASGLGAFNRAPRHLVVMALLTESCSGPGTTGFFGYLVGSGRSSPCEEAPANTLVFDQDMIAWEAFEAEHYPTEEHQLRTGILEVPHTVGVRLGLVPPSRFEDTFIADDRVFEWALWSSTVITTEPLESLFDALAQPIRSRSGRFDVLILVSDDGFDKLGRLGDNLEVFAESLRSQDDVGVVRIDTTTAPLRWVPYLLDRTRVMIETLTT